MYTVYMHKVPNGKVYIGETSQSVKSRWSNGEGYNKQTLFYKDILFYGWSNIEHIVLATFHNKEDAQDYERKMIQKYADISYNIRGKSTTWNAENCRKRYRLGLK